MVQEQEQQQEQVKEDEVSDFGPFGEKIVEAVRFWPPALLAESNRSDQVTLKPLAALKLQPHDLAGRSEPLRRETGAIRFSPNWASPENRTPYKRRVRNISVYVQVSFWADARQEAEDLPSITYLLITLAEAEALIRAFDAYSLRAGYVARRDTIPGQIRAVHVSMHSLQGLWCVQHSPLVKPPQPSPRLPLGCTGAEPSQPPPLPCPLSCPCRLPTPNCMVSSRHPR